MKNIIFTIIIAALLAACDTKDIQLVPTFEESRSAIIDENSTYFQELIISADRINNEIENLDVDKEKVHSVGIEGIWMVIKPLSDNLATGTTINIRVKSWNSGERIDLINNLTFNIPAKDTTIYLHKHLQKLGVTTLKKQLKIIATSDYAGSDIDLHLHGTTIPTNTQIHVSIEVFVRGTIVYNTEMGIFE